MLKAYKKPNLWNNYFLQGEETTSACVHHDIITLEVGSENFETMPRESREKTWRAHPMPVYIIPWEVGVQHIEYLDCWGIDYIS